MATTEEIVLVIVIGGNALFIAWLWYRAGPGSSERILMPALLLLSISMLVGILPRVLWPNAERVKISGSIASMILTASATIVGVRRTRRLRTRSR